MLPPGSFFSAVTSRRGRPRAAPARAARLQLPPPADDRRRRPRRPRPQDDARPRRRRARHGARSGTLRRRGLYLFGHITFLFRTTGRVFRRRSVGAIALLALVLAAVAIPALAALALVGAVCSLVVAYEVLRYRGAGSGSGT